MKREREDQKRKRSDEDENTTQRPSAGGQKSNRSHGQQGSKSGQPRGQGQAEQPGSSRPNRPIDVDEEEEKSRTDQRKRA